MYCVNCGNKLEENYKFCPKCGNKVQTSIKEKEAKEENNDIYEEAKRYVIENKKASASLLQRKFKISYNKASEIIDKLESNGIIGPSNGSKSREVLVEEIKEEKKESVEDKIKNTVEDLMDTPESTSTFDKKEIKDNTFLAILSYLGFFALIPYFFNNKSEYVKYHATQGMNLLIVWVIYSIIENLLGLIKIREVVLDLGTMRGIRMVTPFWISFPMAIIGLVIIVITVIGIVYACEGKAKELPIINKIKIIK